MKTLMPVFDAVCLSGLLFTASVLAEEHAAPTSDTIFAAGPPDRGAQRDAAHRRTRRDTLALCHAQYAAMRESEKQAQRTMSRQTMLSRRDQGRAQTGITPPSHP